MSVTIHTTAGDLKCEIFCDTCPRTAFNFLALAASGKYNGTIFHRNIRGFMIQGGDTAHTTGKKSSIWGDDVTFPDEFHPNNKHDRRGCLSMANRGPNTNKVRKAEALCILLSFVRIQILMDLKSRFDFGSNTHPFPNIATVPILYFVRAAAPFEQHAHGLWPGVGRLGHVGQMGTAAGVGGTGSVTIQKDDAPGTPRNHRDYHPCQSAGGRGHCVSYSQWAARKEMSFEMTSF